MKKGSEAKTNNENDVLIGKASVIPYLNTKLKPIDSNNGETYPVYLRLGFNRKQSAIKSSFAIYIDDENDDLYGLDPDEESFGYEEKCYVTEKEFNALQKSSSIKKKALDKEINIVSELIILYGEYNVNLVSSDPYHLIRASTWTLSSVVDNYFKSQLQADLFKDHWKLSMALDYDMSSFYELFTVLNNYGNPTIKKWLEGQVDKYNTLQFMATNIIHRDENMRVYKSLQEHFRIGMPIWKEVYRSEVYLNYIKEAVIYHFEIFIKDSHPELFQRIHAYLERLYK